MDPVKELEAQMEAAVFDAELKEHFSGFIGAMQIWAALKGVSMDVLSALCMTAALNILYNCANDEARKSYCKTFRRMIDVVEKKE